MRRCLRNIVSLVQLVLLTLPATSPAVADVYKNGFPSDSGFFPIGVWLQETMDAKAYKSLGVNTYVGLWEGPTEAQLSALAREKLFAIADQNDTALTSPAGHVIRAWMQVDEPDNAQPLKGGGWGDCISVAEISKRYAGMKARDSTRPVFLNFSQGVANSSWIGRGDVCSKISEDVYYGAASRGADILSFDIYPVTEFEQPKVLGRLELVAKGVAKLKRWATSGQPVWAIIGVTHVHSPFRRPTAAEIRSMAWMALIRGARGLVYFVHEWRPDFKHNAIFRYPETVAAVRALNTEITFLAPVLNLGLEQKVVDSTGLATMARLHDGVLYVFAVNLTPEPINARLGLQGPGSGAGEVLGENRTVRMESGSFSDAFSPYAVHLYAFPQK